MDADLPITETLSLPGTDLTWTASRSGGPGGQHVNTTDTRVRLTFALSRCEVLRDDVKARLRQACRSWLTQEGDLNLTCDVHRSQHRNLEDARERLAEAVRAALVPPKRRRPTAPSRAARRRRLDQKKARAETKKARGPVRNE